MTALYIVLAVLAVFALIGLIRVGARVRFDESGLCVRARAGPLRIQVFPPAKPKKEKPPKAKKEKKTKPLRKKRREEAQPPPKPKGAILTLVRQLIPLALQAAGEVRRKISIDHLRLDVIWAGADPASVAQTYGKLCAAEGAVWPLLERLFRIGEREVRLACVFDRPSPSITADVQVTLTIGQCVSLGIRTGIKALKIFLRHRAAQKQSAKAVQTHKKQEKAVQQA